MTRLEPGQSFSSSKTSLGNWFREAVGSMRTATIVGGFVAATAVAMAIDAATPQRVYGYRYSMATVIVQAVKGGKPPTWSAITDPQTPAVIIPLPLDDGGEVYGVADECYDNQEPDVEGRSEDGLMVETVFMCDTRCYHCASSVEALKGHKLERDKTDLLM